MQSRTNILFPIEIINREVDYRLFLACAYAREDNRIYVGRHTYLRHLIGVLNGGVYLGKNLILPRFPEAKLDLYQKAKARGFAVAQLDEEGAVHPGDAESWKRTFLRRLDPRVLKADDYVCTWGDFPRDYYRSLHPTCEENIVTTGHPRFDLYRPEFRSFFDDEVLQLCERFGDFVLFNTNLFRANNRRGLDDTFSDERGYDASVPEKRRDTVNHWAYHSYVLGHFIRLMTHLSLEMPLVNFVIRPHPAENFEFYKTIFKDIANVHVVHEGSVGPWLLASRCVIHDGCTTAIEAHLCGTPILNYKATHDERYDKYLPNIFGLHCHSPEEAHAALEEILQSKWRDENAQKSHDISDAEIPETAHSLFNNFRGEAFGPTMKVMDEIAAALPSGIGREEKAYSQSAIQKTRDKLRSINPRRRDPLYHPRYGFNPFYGFGNVDVKTKMEKIQAILQKKVRYKILHGELIVIEG